MTDIKRSVSELRVRISHRSRMASTNYVAARVGAIEALLVAKERVDGLGDEYSDSQGPRDMALAETIIVLEALIAELAGGNNEQETSMGDRKEVLIPAGTLIHVGGLPFELTVETTVYGSEENLALGLAALAQPHTSSEGASHTLTHNAGQ